MSPIKLSLPYEQNRYFASGVNYELPADMLFVFGSNLAGRHGKGAAKTAAMEYGAIYGVGSGVQNNCYAIPTKDSRIVPLPLDIINEHVQAFKRFVIDNPGKTFFVTAVGTGYAGYHACEIAPMFKGVTRCWLPDVWERYLLPSL